MGAAQRRFWRVRVAPSHHHPMNSAVPPLIRLARRQPRFARIAHPTTPSLGAAPQGRTECDHFCSSSRSGGQVGWCGRSRALCITGRSARRSFLHRSVAVSLGISRTGRFRGHPAPKGSRVGRFNREFLFLRGHGQRGAV
jgi:hypothetical protein